MSLLQSKNAPLLLALAAVGAAYVFLLFVPSLQASAELRSQASAYRDYTIQSQDSETMVQRFQQELKETRAYAQAWSDAAPTERKLTIIHQQIDEAASKSGVAIRSIQPQVKSEALETIKRLEVPMEIEGEFPQIFHFLRNLEKQPFVCWTEDTQIREINNRQPLQCDLRLVVFLKVRG